LFEHDSVIGLKRRLLVHLNPASLHPIWSICRFLFVTAFLTVCCYAIWENITIPEQQKIAKAYLLHETSESFELDKINVVTSSKSFLCDAKFLKSISQPHQTFVPDTAAVHHSSIWFIDDSTKKPIVYFTIEKVSWSGGDTAFLSGSKITSGKSGKVGDYKLTRKGAVWTVVDFDRTMDI
jgi:hypothetical protein